MPFDAAPVVRSPLPDNIAGQSALVLEWSNSTSAPGRNGDRASARKQEHALRSLEH